MAGQPISITRGSTTLSATATQASKEAIDLQGVSGLRFDLALRGYFISGAGASVAVKVQTSMFNDDNPGNWVDLVTFTAVTTSNLTEVGSVDSGVLRYLRYVATLNANTTSFTFEILGMAW